MPQVAARKTQDSVGNDLRRVDSSSSTSTLDLLPSTGTGPGTRLNLSRETNAWPGCCVGAMGERYHATLDKTVGLVRWSLAANSLGRLGMCGDVGHDKTYRHSARFC